MMPRSRRTAGTGRRGPLLAERLPGRAIGILHLRAGRTIGHVNDRPGPDGSRTRTGCGRVDGRADTAPLERRDTVAKLADDALERDGAAPVAHVVTSPSTVLLMTSPSVP